jgi:HEAT repeat protein
VHGGQLPSVRAAAEAEVTELRTRALSIADRALDVVEDALEDKDPNVRLRASAQLLDRVLPARRPGRW